MTYSNQSVDCGYQRIYLSLIWADIITHLEQKEYVKSVHLIELKIKNIFLSNAAKLQRKERNY